MNCSLRDILYCVVLLALCGGEPGSARARTVEGYRFDESVRVGTVNLLLNGVGIRSVSIFKGYVAALYVPEKSNDASRLLGQHGPKRVTMRMLLSADTTTFVRALSGGLQRNSSALELQQLRTQIETFSADLREVQGVKPGDLVEVEFLPGNGTRVLLNGRSLGKPVPGEEFYSAFLKIFIGQNVQDLHLKAGLLGSRAPPDLDPPRKPAKNPLAGPA